MRPGAQAALVDLAYGRVLLQHGLAEGDDVVEPAALFRQRLGQEQPFGGEFRLLGAERHQPHGAHIVDMPDDEHGGKVHRVVLSGGAFTLAEAVETVHQRGAVL